MNTTLVRPEPSKGRNFRIPDHEYLPALEKSRQTKVPLTSIVRAAIREWVQR